MKFNAVIDNVHFDPKKGSVKIVLVGASPVSLDELITLSPKEETVRVTLESEQTKIADVGDPITLDEDALLEKLKEAAERLGSDEELAGEDK